MEANYPKSPREMYEDLAGIREGGSLYTLQRTEPLTIEHIERISRSSKSDSKASADRLTVSVTSSGGKRYRLVIDCGDERCAMEHIRDGEWVTYSNDLSGFRYRSPNHPENGEKWQYE